MDTNIGRLFIVTYGHLLCSEESGSQVWNTGVSLEGRKQFHIVEIGPPVTNKE